VSEPIKAGDLCLVIRSNGAPWMAGYVVTCKGHSDECAEDETVIHHPGVLLWSKDISIIPVSWLKRIPPLSELDDVKHDEEITA
jgi:hypothetical protein